MLAGPVNLPHCAAMRSFGPPPSIEELEELARRSLENLPGIFADHLPGIVLTVEDFADEQTLKEMGIAEPFELTGLYEGIPIGEKRGDLPAALPDRIRLFRRPILDEWADGEETLEGLVRHVLVHEVGHHFGLSDEDMHAIEDLE
jgi:predicted Zn-dependent protease with MMP-like domain